jgi:hypothetical protein
MISPLAIASRLLYADTSQDALIDGVPGEFELIRFDLFA